jgi:hypothetical protein
VIAALLFVVAFFALLMVFRSSDIFGWLTENTRSDAGGININIGNEFYDIVINRTTEFDTIIAGRPKYEGIEELKTLLGSDPYLYSLTESSTGEAPKLAYELVSEVSATRDGVSYYSLMPGSCGTVTFYIRQKVGFDFEGAIGVILGCFTKQYVNDTLTLVEIDNQTVLDLLRGHLLFFTQRTGTGPSDYKYNGLMEDSMLVFDTADLTLSTDPGYTDCYKFVLYWEWPLTYYNMEENISSSPWEKKYPAELEDFIEDHRTYFFATNIYSNDPEDLYDGYNDGDQTIGENAQYVVVYLAPDR